MLRAIYSVFQILNSLLGYGLLVVEERPAGRVVGEVGLADFHRGLGEDFDPFPEFAWMMASEVHGRGYATEAEIGRAHV